MNLRILLTIMGVVISPLMTAQDIHDSHSFVNDYLERYEQYKSAYTDTTLLYVPCIMNLYEYGTEWLALSPSQRKDSLFSFLEHPILANDIALDVNNDEYYVFPLGQLYYCGEIKGYEMAGPITYRNWYHETVIIPLINYALTSRTHYLFSIENLSRDYYNGYYWSIEDAVLYALVYDRDTNVFHSVRAESFLDDQNYTWLFYVFDSSL